MTYQRLKQLVHVSGVVERAVEQLVGELNTKGCSECEKIFVFGSEEASDDSLDFLCFLKNLT